MVRFRQGGALSSRDLTTRVIAVRLPPDLVSAIDATCAEQGITPSEFLRGIVSSWVYGKSQLAGPDEGYTQARSMAAQLAMVAVKRALAELPEDHDGARSMLEGYYNEAAERRKR